MAVTLSEKAAKHVASYMAKRGKDGEKVLVRVLNIMQGQRYIEICERNPTQEQFFYFLSCLYGSERRKPHSLQLIFFLSCLYGSERIGGDGVILFQFLSCLYGSEPCSNW